MVRSLLLSLLLFLMLPSASECQTISGPEVRLLNNDVFVSFSLNLDGAHIQGLKQGIDKELKLHIDLFRVWRSWPDEFVLGKFYTRTLRADPIKKEFVSTSFDGSVIVEKRFRSFESMVDWALTVKDLKLTNMRELDPGQYFVRITMESKVRRLPPVIGYFLIFLAENEFKIMKESAPFSFEGSR
ncbi:MAG: DUF4390 domain-containing protein [Nitrospirae bacterium]|nr:DUF4390 domain-containing protein [Nitrospirota bacterium]